jgi:antitoxin (DNA-binding transcriptional repressor) of toxin-antitoxin stability system
MVKVDLKDIERDLTGYLGRVQSGETVVVMQADKPVAQIQRVSETDAAEPKAPQRPFGLCAGEFTVPADFDAPLPDELLRDFEGK